MAHRKYESPRHGSLGFLPKKRCKRNKGKIKAFPSESQLAICHLTASIGYKVGMTHVVREIDKPGSKLHKKDVVEAVTVLETPSIIIAGLIGYTATPRGLRAFKTIWSNNLCSQFKRNFYKNWYKSKKKAFSKYKNETNLFETDNKYREIKKVCVSIRCIGYTNIKTTNLKKKRGDIIEIQINGGTVEKKITFCSNLLGKQIGIDNIFKQNENIDVIGITKGKGVCGVVKRWGVTKLPRKTRRGTRKVACVGSWHPSRVSFKIPRAGQLGHHHRTQLNFKIFKIGKSIDKCSGSTDLDIIKKTITPMGGFPRYGIVKSDFVILKGCCVGCKKSPITMRKRIHMTPQIEFENVNLKFIDTSSKWGHGKYQTTEEKKNIMTKI